MPSDSLRTLPTSRRNEDSSSPTVIQIPSEVSVNSVFGSDGLIQEIVRTDEPGLDPFWEEDPQLVVVNHLYTDAERHQRAGTSVAVLTPLTPEQLRNPNGHNSRLTANKRGGFKALSETGLNRAGTLVITGDAGQALTRAGELEKILQLAYDSERDDIFPNLHSVVWDTHINRRVKTSQPHEFTDEMASHENKLHEVVCDALRDLQDAVDVLCSNRENGSDSCKLRVHAGPCDLAIVSMVTRYDLIAGWEGALARVAFHKYDGTFVFDVTRFCQGGTAQIPTALSDLWLEICSSISSYRPGKRSDTTVRLTTEAGNDQAMERLKGWADELKTIATEALPDDLRDTLHVSVGDERPETKELYEVIDSDAV